MIKFFAGPKMDVEREFNNFESNSNVEVYNMDVTWVSDKDVRLAVWYLPITSTKVPGLHVGGVTSDAVRGFGDVRTRAPRV